MNFLDNQFKLLIFIIKMPTYKEKLLILVIFIIYK